MKRILKIWLVAVLALVGCDRGFEELNVNPNLNDDVDPDQLLAYAQFKLHTDYFNGVLTEVWGLNMWMQVQADINGISSAGDEYFIGGDALDNTWRLYYSEVLGNISQALRILEDDPEGANKRSILRIYRAYVFQRLTDLWGDIPYSDAFQAINDENVPDFTPEYDGQRSIYIDLMNELQDASELLDDQQPSFSAEDWIYQGNVAHWRRFANSLRLRMAVRVSGVEPELASEHGIQLMAEDNFISSNFNGAHFPHSSFARSPFFELHNTGQGMRNPSHFLVELLKADEDPRVGWFAEHSPESIIQGAPDYFGVPNFLLASEIDNDELNSFTTSYIGEYFQDQDREGTILSFAESCFLQAEASMLGWGGAMTTEEYFDEGVRAHMEFLGVEDDAISEYLAGAGDFDGTTSHIAAEKWKTLVFTDSIELFSEYRRTGVPVLTDEEGEQVDLNRIPKRFAYPNSELSLNGDNVLSVGEGINDFDTPVWWDQE